MNNSLLSASINVGFDTLRGNPVRTLLSTLGVIMGVGALVSVLSLGDGMQEFARNQIAETTDLQSIAITPELFRTVDGQRFPRTDAVRFTVADAESLEQALGARAGISLMEVGSAIVTTPGDTTLRAAEVAGTLANMAESRKLVVAEGRF